MKYINHIYNKNLEIDNIIKNFIIDCLEIYYNSIKKIIYNE